MSGDLNQSHGVAPPGPSAFVARTMGAVGALCALAIYAVVGPLLAIGTGFVRILSEIRETAVRPRPFVGAHHGLPFLDRRPVAMPATAQPHTKDAETPA